MDLKYIIKHLSNGTLAENACLICLAPLGELYENIYTKICKEDHEFCVADVLQAVCQMKIIDDNINYNVCLNCFVSACLAYKFFLITKQSQEILNFYTDQLLDSISRIDHNYKLEMSSLCLSLPRFIPETQQFDFALEGLGKKISTHFLEDEIKKEDTDDIVVIVEDGNKKHFYNISTDGIMSRINNGSIKNHDSNQLIQNKVAVVNVKRKPRKKRGPMIYKKCSMCPIKYRFNSKLIQHMKTEHNVDLYICKICQAMTDSEEDYRKHLRTHTDVHQCAKCFAFFKRRDSIIAHLKWHEQMNEIQQSEVAHICEVCGQVLDSEENLSKHYDCKHRKKFTCYYCGRMYKGEISFETHLKKHEEQLRNKELNTKTNIIIKQNSTSTKEKAKKQEKSKPHCKVCGRYFVDQRSLMWHQRLHNNERPYTCDLCGRGFVSLNRRNQHRVCAHSAPSRRCPLCPALFHLRSMVNTHLKKVHLKAHKRKNRTRKYQNVFWRTETVPFQELSVAVQEQILELQTKEELDTSWANASNSIT